MGADEREQDYLAFVATRSLALRRTAYLLTGDWHTAADLVQSAVLAGYQRRSRLRDPAAFEPYVRRILVTHFLSWRRRRSWSERPAAHLPEPLAQADPAEAYADADPVRTALQQLSPRQRAVLTLRFYNDLPQAQIADILGCSRASVATHTTRGLDALRTLLDVQEERR